MPLEDRLRRAAEAWLQRAKGNLARAKQPKPPDDLWEADNLSEYATVARYPGSRPASEEDHRRAVLLAERVVRWAEGIIHGR